MAAWLSECAIWAARYIPGQGWAQPDAIGGLPAGAPTGYGNRCSRSATVARLSSSGRPKSRCPRVDSLGSSLGERYRLEAGRAHRVGRHHEHSKPSHRCQQNLPRRSRSAQGWVENRLIGPEHG